MSVHGVGEITRSLMVIKGFPFLFNKLTREHAVYIPQMCDVRVE